MAVRHQWINRLRYLGRRSRFEDDLDEEVRFHIESRAAELHASGLPLTEAVQQARREFGSLARAGEGSRDAWQFRWIEDLASDFRYGLRSFRRSPGFALTAVFSLALGIGANAAIFTAVYTVLWKPLPVAHPESLTGFSILSAHRRESNELPLAFVGQLQRAGIFDGVSVMSNDGLSFTYDERAERVVGEVVSPNYFDLLGVPALVGQPFTAGVRSGHWAAETVLSYSFWKRRFGGDPAIVGRTIRLNQYPFTVVGVSPPGFFGLDRGTDFELRIPILPDGQDVEQIAEIAGRADREMFAFARLKPGSSPVQAESAAFAQLQEFLRATSVRRFRDRGAQHLALVTARRVDNGIVPSFRTPLYVLFVLVALVLLIACANVANMLLARSSARAREFAVRTSIGAGRFRLVRQMLAESLLLSLLAGALAVAIGNWVAGLLAKFLPQGHIATSLDLGLDANTLLFTLALSLVTCLLFGLAPALHATRGDQAVALKMDTAFSRGNPRGGRIRKSLVASQVAFSLLLLIAAGVFVRTMIALRPTDFAGRPDRVLLFTMKPQQEIYTPGRRLALIAELVRRISALPGVRSAAVAENGPLGSRASSDTVETPGRPQVKADIDWVTPGFFETVGVSVIQGRDFANESADAVINRSLAQLLFPGENPIGRTIRFSPGRTGIRSFEIVGVVSDSHYYSVHVPPRPSVWFSFQEYAPPYMPTLHVRTATGDIAATVAAVRREFDAVDKGFPIFNIKTLEVRIQESLARERMLADLSGAIGLLALSLAAVGLYGILAYSVSQRTREIGIRMALGSDAASVAWLIAREALLLIAAGSVAGVMLSLASWRLLSHQIPGISSIDAPVLGLCAGLMLVLSAAAVAVPAVRACRIDPLEALRYQ